MFSPTYLIVPNRGISPEWLIFGVLCKLQFLLVEHPQISHSCLHCASLLSYLSKNCSNKMHCIMIVKSFYKFQTIFQHVLVAPTTTLSLPPLTKTLLF